MCPACFASAALVAAWIAGTASTAGMTAVAFAYLNPKAAANSPKLATNSDSNSKENPHVHSND
jgi:hypothetical protein